MNEPQMLRRGETPGQQEEPVTIVKVNEGALFPSGQICFSQGVAYDTEAGAINPTTYLHRHFHGDWGDLDTHDAKENNFSVNRQLRILSSYDLPPDHPTGERKVWVITEADRSATMVLYPSEY